MQNGCESYSELKDISECMMSKSARLHCIIMDIIPAMKTTFSVQIVIKICNTWKSGMNRLHKTNPLNKLH